MFIVEEVFVSVDEECRRRMLERILANIVKGTAESETMQSDGCTE